MAWKIRTIIINHGGRGCVFLFTFFVLFLMCFIRKLARYLSKRPERCGKRELAEIYGKF